MQVRARRRCCRLRHRQLPRGAEQSQGLPSTALPTRRWTAQRLSCPAAWVGRQASRKEAMRRTTGCLCRCGRHTHAGCAPGTVRCMPLRAAARANAVQPCLMAPSSTNPHGGRLPQFIDSCRSAGATPQRVAAMFSNQNFKAKATTHLHLSLLLVVLPQVHSEAPCRCDGGRPGCRARQGAPRCTWYAELSHPPSRLCTAQPRSLCMCLAFEARDARTL